MKKYAHLNEERVRVDKLLGIWKKWKTRTTIKNDEKFRKIRKMFCNQRLVVKMVEGQMFFF